MIKAFRNPAVSLVALVLWNCGNNYNPSSVDYAKTGKEALVIVVENNDLLDSMLSLGYAIFRDQLNSIFADVFEVDETEIPDSATLEEVIDRFGEDWQIRELTGAARPYYSRTVRLTDSGATEKALLDSLSSLQNGGFVIDMIFNLHGGYDLWTGRSSVLFADGSRDVSAFTDSLKNRSVSIRALYQTCCYGSFMIPDWERAGITAVNGALDVNSFSIFSPVIFLESWTAGMTFDGAVHAAYDGEIARLSSYRSKLEEIDLLLTSDVLASSTQNTGGSDSLLMWKTVFDPFAPAEP